MKRSPSEVQPGPEALGPEWCGSQLQRTRRRSRKASLSLPWCRSSREDAVLWQLGRAGPWASPAFLSERDGSALRACVRGGGGRARTVRSEVRRGEAAPDPRTHRLSGPYGRQQPGGPRCCPGRRRRPQLPRRPLLAQRPAPGQRLARRMAQRWLRRLRAHRALWRPGRGSPESALPARRSPRGPPLPGASPSRQGPPGLKPGLPSCLDLQPPWKRESQRLQRGDAPAGASGRR